LHKTLDLRQQRHTVLASNIANAETPGFIAKDVRFEEALRAAATPPPQPPPLAQTHPEHSPHIYLPSIHNMQRTVFTPPPDDVGRELNTVSIDREMAKLTTNPLHYNGSVEILSRAFDQPKRPLTRTRHGKER